MTIEDDDRRERKIWTKVSKRWYQMVCDQAPWTGRLYHDFAILSRPNNMLQAFYYIKSLTVPTPFYSARESILALFQLAVPRDSERKQKWKGTKDEKNFITACAYLFLASQDKTLLEKKGYGSAPETYLIKFDAALRGIEAPQEPVPVSEGREVARKPNPDAEKRDAEAPKVGIHKAEMYEAETSKAEKCEAGEPSADESNQEEGNDNPVTVVKPSRYAIQPRYVPQ
jgi:hypothetical protein